ncbi:MAG: 5-formyltetrahydrofolate cyclo-ligase [Clostridia bacterium]|nr:5-formyltetrahydrofolate cyclo-ligase [Clostridia bacterium]
MVKKEIRKRFKEIRKNLRGNITSEFFKTDLYKNAGTIFSFVSYGSEIGTVELINKALSDGKIAAVPYMTGKPHEMVFIKIKSMVELKPNKIGILEPEYRAESILKSDKNTVIIVPGLAFDKEFYRIGYGGGYYDKYIDENEYMLTVGVCFEEQITDLVPRENTDRAVDIIVTDKMIRRKQYENIK